MGGWKKIMHPLRRSESWANAPELASVERIKTFETQFGVEIPSQFKEFLLTIVNGGPPIEEYSFPLPNDDWTDLRYISGFRPGGYDLDHCFTELIGEVYPKVCFPAAWDSLGNSIYLISAGENQGKVYFYDHDRYDQIAENPFLFPVANSFWEFLETARLDSELDFLQDI